MKSITKLLTIALAIAAASTSFAREGFYLQGDLGFSAFSKLGAFDTTTDASTKKKGFSGGISGGYLFEVQDKLFVGPELGLQALGKIHRSAGAGSVDIDQYFSALDILGVISYELAEDFEVSAKAGLAFVYGDYSGRTVGISEDYSKDFKKTVAKVAGSVGYNITKNWQVNSTLSHYFGKEQNLENKYREIPSITNISAGVRYTF